MSCLKFHLLTTIAVITAGRRQRFPGIQHRKAMNKMYIVTLIVSAYLGSFNCLSLVAPAAVLVIPILGWWMMGPAAGGCCWEPNPAACGGYCIPSWLGATMNAAICRCGSWFGLYWTWNCAWSGCMCVGWSSSTGGCWLGTTGGMCRGASCMCSNKIL